MDAGAAINMAETDLRALIREVLGDDWLAKSGCDRARLEGRRSEEHKRRPGAVVEQDLIAYAEFYELKQAIVRNWDAFSTVWRTKRYFEAIFDRLEDFRNPDAHSRQLLPFEQHLVLGLSGEMRNTITLYRSSTAVTGEHYPIIELVADSVGNRFTPIEAQQTGSGFTVPSRFAVGDVVRFELKAWDPQGREVSWSVTLYARTPQEAFELKGAEAGFDWVVTEEDVGDNVALIGITMSSSGRYHRNRKHDSFVSLYLTVDPPRL